MKNTSKDYAMYLRKSRKDIELEALGQGETLARHRSALTELAERQGLHIARIYEEMVSGESIAARPKMQELLDEVCAGVYAGVLVMEIERLARGNTKDQGEVAEAFAMSNTLIVTPTKTYDPTNEFDEEYFEFGLFMSRREYKTIRRRMQRGLMESIKEGNYVGSLPPYGYDIIRISKKERTLKPNDQAQYVKLIFDLFTEDHLTAGQIAKRLTSMGVPTQTGRPEWNRATVRDILQNTLYTGQIRWNRRKRTKEMGSGKQIQKKRRLTPEEYMTVPGKHPALISQEQFDAAQSAFGTGNPVKDGTPLKNPLSRLIFCKYCGKAIKYQEFPNRKGNTQPRMSHTESTTCMVKSAPYNQVMEALVAALRAYIDDFTMKLTNGEEQRAAQRHADTLTAMMAELSKLEQRRSQLFDYLEQGIYTPAEFAERKNVLTDRIEAAQRGIEEFKASQPPAVDYQEMIVKFTECVNALESPDVPAQSKNNLLKSIISRIEYDCIDNGRNKGGTVVLDIKLK